MFIDGWIHARFDNSREMYVRVETMSDGFMYDLIHSRGKYVRIDRLLFGFMDGFI